MNVPYIVEHISRIETIYCEQESMILDSKWRIASNADLFSVGELRSDGSLTPEQEAQINAFINEFKQNYLAA